MAGAKKAGVGISNSDIVNLDDTSAAIGAGSTVLSSAADAGIKVAAESKQDIANVSVSAGAGTESTGVGGVLGVIVSLNKAEALIGDGARVQSKGDVAVTATNDTNAVMVSGGIGGGKEVGVGAAVAANIIANKTLASIDDNAVVDATKNLTVAADADESAVSVTVAGAGGGKVGVAGAISLNVILSDTEASVGQGAKLNADAAWAHITGTSDQTVAITAHDDTVIVGVGGGVAGAGKVGVGAALDTAVMVIRDLQKNCPEDKHVQQLNLPGCIDFLLQNKWFGDKSGKGFYEKTNRKDDKGKPVILGLDLSSQQHVPEVKSDLESLKLSRQIEDLSKRLRALIQCNDAGGEFIRQTLGFLLAYTADRIPEITENLYAVDDAMKNGYAWELGPFEYWDAIGLEMGLELIRASGETPSNWVVQMQSNGVKSFYQHSDGMLTCYNPVSGKYDPVPDVEKKITINLLAGEKLVYSNPELKLWDIGEGVLCAEFCSKYNAIGEGILNGLNESVRIAEEQQWQGLVIGNNAPNFTVGANLMLIGMLAFQQEYDQLDMAVRLFQNTSMRLRYSSIPVIAVTQGYVFGGGTEFLMHCDGAVCAAESYIGLVEVGVGLIPGGGGTKEFAMRFADEIREGEVMIPQLIQKFRTIATASVATSAFEAYDLGYLSAQRDVVSLDLKAAIYHGKQKVIQLAPHYIRPLQRTEVMVLGRSGLGTLQAAAHTMYRGGYASEHDVKIANKIAYVLCGGDLSAPQMVSEQYLLDLEREAFLSLCTEPKTMERIQFMLENNKPLRN
ncbi:MAG TPA: enoyl-CoA hydratase/isomerase family protein [Saprospiraceae bacterium]|nr:enoyl-CoA hydratase/isomerase family protein [Saprospiraceae bacterium]